MIAKIKFVVMGVFSDEPRGLIVMAITPMRIRNNVPEPKATTDEEIVVKKMMDTAKKFAPPGTIAIGLPGCNIEMLKDHGHETGLYLTLSEFEKMGKPNVGDVLDFYIRKVKKTIKIDGPAYLQKINGKGPSGFASGST